MLKNKNGITMIALVITIIVMIIIASISFVTGKELLDSSRIKEYITTMYLIKGEVENMNESYEFDGDIGHLEGEKLDVDYSSEKLKEIYDNEGMTARKYEISSTEPWYILDKDALKKFGIETSMLEKGEVFIVNYNSGTIIYSKGYTANGQTTYSLEGLQNL